MRRDFVRCQILSRKISKRHLNTKDLEKFKIEYFGFMIQYYVHEKMTLETAKSYQTIFDTLNKADDEIKAKLDPEGKQLTTSFQNFVIYVLNGPYDNEKVDLLNIIVDKYARELEKNDMLSRYVNKLLTFELMPLNEKEIETQMFTYSPFQEETENNKQHMRDFIR